MGYQYSDEDLLRILRETAEELGRTPTQAWMNKNGEVTARTCENRFGSWNAALREAGLEKNRRSEITDEELLDSVRESVERLGHCPSRDWYREHGGFGANTLVRRFGSWNQDLLEAGFEPSKLMNIPKSRLVRALKRAAGELGHPPSTRWMNENGEFSEGPYYDQFGTWPEALEAADLEYDTNLDKFTDGKLIDAIRKASEAVGGTPTSHWMNENGEASAVTCSRRFGSWNDALRAAGLSVIKEDVNDVDELKDALLELRDEVGRTPKRDEMDELGRFSASTYSHHFGSWTAAVEAVGLNPNRMHCTEEELITILKNVEEELGHPPTTSWMEGEGPVSVPVYTRRFGSWNNALQKAGIGINQPREWPEDVLIQVLQKTERELGTTPTAPWMEKHGEICASVYMARFGSWNAAVTAAGLEPNEVAEAEPLTLLNHLIDVAETLGQPPTALWMEEEGDFSAATYARYFGSWNDALGEAGLKVNQTCGGSQKVECSNCGEMASRPLSQVRAGDMYCDARCYNEHRERPGGPKIPMGTNWDVQRQRAIQRDGEKCTVCGLPRSEHIETYGCDLNVHHVTPREEFWDGEVYDEARANRLDNLLTLCVRHHGIYESLPVRPQLGPAVG